MADLLIITVATRPPGALVDASSTARKIGNIVSSMNLAGRIGAQDDIPEWDTHGERSKGG